MARVSGISAALPPPAGPYSHAVRIGELAHVAGQVGVLPQTGQAVGPRCREQTQQALANLGAALATIGATADDVLRCGVYLTELDDFAEMNEEYAAFFGAPYSARTTVYVGLPSGLRVEIDALVVLYR